MKVFYIIEIIVSIYVIFFVAFFMIITLTKIVSGGSPIKGHHLENFVDIEEADRDQKDEAYGPR